MLAVPPSGLRPGLALALALSGVAAATGCGGETGIVLEIHKAPGVSSEVYRFQIFAGVGHDPDLIDEAWWVAAELDDAEELVALDAELGATTYRYLVRPGGGLGLDTKLVFAVAGYKDESDLKPVVFGHSEAPVRFGDGEVRVYDFPLVTFADARHGVTATGCAWWDDEGTRLKRDAIAPRSDGDCDAYQQDPDATPDCMLDCNDRDPAVHPGRTEVCGDGVDQNCCDDDDGRDDLDGDGFAACGTATPDCVDLAPGTPGPVNVFGDEVAAAEIHPGAVELCDGLDNDCKLGCDEPLDFDPDADSYLNCQKPGQDEVKGVHRTADGCLATDRDCLEVQRVGAPAPATVHPDALDDQCDGWDNNCDGQCDEVLRAQGDRDGDGFAACTTEGDYAVDLVPQCQLGTGADCGGDDSEFEYPGRAERCDGVDFDCDLVLFPPQSPCFTVDANGGRCVLGRRPCDDTPGSASAGFGACEREAAGPATALPDEWCAVSCTLADDRDPVQCLDGAAGAQACRIDFPVPTVVAPCMLQPAEIPLPMDVGVGGCAYLLVGGMQQGDWNLTLVNPIGGTGPTADGCGSRLRVVGARPAAEDRVVLVLSGVAPHVFVLRRQDQECDAGGGVHCTNQ